MKKRILITSALPYINGIKHLGNLVGSMLPADVYARFMRQRGHEVLYICATDEHGTPAELAAAAKQQTPAKYCQEMHAVQQKLGEQFLLSWQHFGRSSCVDNHELTRHFYQRLRDADLIEERDIQQIYSVKDGRFLPDRYVIGTCPHCGYEKARGDQCESCTRVLDPSELKQPYSAISGSKELELRHSRHIFLRQSQMADRLRAWINSQKTWPLLVTSIALKWLDEGLHDRCITRDLSWGVKVGDPGFEDKVFYVWFDAPIAYIAATKEWADKQDQDWQSWWRDDQGADNVRYVQFMAKDNVPFHTISFPATLLGSGEDWKTADYIKGFNWLTYYGGKFSTSSGRGLFMDQALEILPADYWRWYLMANAPEGTDYSFTWEELQTAVNKDMADAFGNFINRIMKFSHSRFGDSLPEVGEWSDTDKEYMELITKKVIDYIQTMEQMEFRKATSLLRSIWITGNQYLQVAAPWTTIKTDKQAAATSTYLALNMVYLFASLAQVFMPDIAQKVLDCFNDANPYKLDYQTEADVAAWLQHLCVGQKFTLPPVLVNKLDDDWIAARLIDFPPM